MYRQKPRKSDLSPRLVILGAGLAIAGALALLPPDRANAVRWPLLTALKPGQRAVAAVRRSAGQTLAGVNDRFASAEDRARRLAEARALREENRRLRAELRAAQLQVELLAEKNRPSNRLLVAGAVRARVLGVQARAFVAKTHLLDAGRADGAERGAAVIQEAATVVDQGVQGGVQNGQVVLAGCRVWGKVLFAGDHASSVCRMTEPGFRDLVCLAAPPAEGRPARRGPRGILEGTGEPLARLRMIAATEPVAEGDLVYSLAGEGFVEEPLLCGRVARVQRPQGAACWELWVEPAADDSDGELAILRAAVNPGRMAQAAADPIRK